MQAIHVKYLGPTNNQPGRLKAQCSAGSVIIQYPHETGAFRTAADALCKKLGWLPPDYSELVEGDLPDGSSVFVFLPRATTKG